MRQSSVWLIILSMLKNSVLLFPGKLRTVTTARTIGPLCLEYSMVTSSRPDNFFVEIRTPNHSPRVNGKVEYCAGFSLLDVQSDFENVNSVKNPLKHS